MMDIYLGVWLNEHQGLSETEWEQLAHDIEEFLSTHPKYHTLEFDVNLEEVP